MVLEWTPEEARIDLSYIPRAWEVSDLKVKSVSLHLKGTWETQNGRLRTTRHFV